ncbi:hypothetical protein J4217_02705 [Candidatus Pacearchaeota archaeon]|nr:hypothetical protein [Candidatus Pacearchaeota archaeon]
MKKKGEISTEMVVWIVIAILVLIIFVVLSIYLRAKGIGAIEFVKNIFRFGS